MKEYIISALLHYNNNVGIHLTGRLYNKVNTIHCITVGVRDRLFKIIYNYIYSLSVWDTFLIYGSKILCENLVGLLEHWTTYYDDHFQLALCKWSSRMYTICYFNLHTNVSTKNVNLFQSSYYSKLEKADILEMTVKYLRNLKRQQMNGKYNMVLLSLTPTV